MKKREKLPKDNKVIDAILALLFAGYLIFTIGITDADAGVYIDAGVYYSFNEFNDSGVSGHDDFPGVLKLEVGYQHDSGFYAHGVHYSNPQAADTGLNMIGGGFRHEF